MLSSTNELPPGVADEQDLLIRSLTHIISIICSKVTDSQKTHGHRALDILDRVALAFVSGFEGGDVAAVTARYDSTHLTIESIQQRTAASAHLDVSKNGPRRGKPDPRNIKSDQTTVLDDPILYCLGRGIEHISPEDHAHNLETLLEQLYSQEPEPKHTDKIRRYLYCFCIAKLQHRLMMPYPGRGETRFLDLFLSNPELPLDDITKDEFTKRGPLPGAPPGLENVSEDWLCVRLNGALNTNLFQLSDKQHLTLTDNQPWGLWVWFRERLKGTRKAIIDAKRLLAGGKTGDVEELRKNISTIIGGLELTDLLLRKSPSFWRLLASLDTLFYQRATIKLSLLSPQQSHERSATASSITPENASEIETGMDDHSNDKDSDEQLENDASDDLLSEGFRPHIAKGEPKLALADHIWLDQDSPMWKVSHWLRSIVQWHRLTLDLVGKARLGIFTRTLRIHASAAPSPSQPLRQASLVDTLRLLVDPTNVETADLDTIFNKINELTSLALGFNPRPPKGPLYSLLNASLSNKAVLEEWENQFTGRIHCETFLACELQSTGAALGINSGDVVTHGRVYPCALPSAVPVEVKRQLLEDLVKILKSRLVQQIYGCLTPDSGAASDSEERVMVPDVGDAEAARDREAFANFL
ncbi:hypothetical protein FRC04_001070 [Tulasnella sp. 424]|nr:hypothetical protein FRC04_001070 [Tulasnella sp. 424]KAG8969837.1 hypothetical protein FRC05_000814 [Tulasnella sp. 425]